MYNITISKYALESLASFFLFTFYLIVINNILNQSFNIKTISQSNNLDLRSNIAHVLSNDSFEYKKINFTSRPGGLHCTKIFRPDFNLEEFTNFVGNHFADRLNNDSSPEIKVVSHFGSDGSELYSFVLRLIKTFGYDKVKNRFLFEARDFDKKIISEAQKSKILLITKAKEGRKTDMDRIFAAIGPSINLEGENVNSFDVFKPVWGRQIISDPFQFQPCRVHDKLSKLVTFKQEDIHNIPDEDIDILFARNQLTHLLQNSSAKDVHKILSKMHSSLCQKGVLVLSKFDSSNFQIAGNCNGLFNQELSGFSGEVYLK